ncbi:CopG family transcriptional regulator [Caulobacter segnis]|uniref:CopG family transcriptional regulator n=1 Tax=Caulobacter segnis TaxID=88688 RepID=UPI002410A9BB|nr:CopG family transcriptional regulator [Caulobacter segnis]MDG2522901.1 CopG family transcriptional regulator [Caulobacter segnis]
MRKARLSVYLETQTLSALTAFAEDKGRSLSLVAEAAIAAYVAPAVDEARDAALLRRLDRLGRQMDRGERDAAIVLETLALFIRHWLQASPPIAEDAKPAARARGAARYDAFVEALGRRLASGRRLSRELPLEEPQNRETA